MIKVSLEVSRRIRTSRDLSDYYACTEREMSDRQIMNLNYCFPKEEQERIDRLMDNISYTTGCYDESNVSRIVGKKRL